ncbi:MAG: methyl-accepting chemotaxis protein [Actinomycetes bacterium]
MFKKKNTSFKNKLLATVFIFVLIIFSVITFQNIRKFNSLLDEDLARELKSVGILTTMQLDPKDLTALKDVTSDNDPAFIENQKLLDDIQKQQGIMSWSYIWEIQGDEIIPIGYTSNLNEIYNPGEKFDNLSPIHTDTAKKSMNSGTPEVTPIFEDDYGVWKTVFVPLKDNSGQVFGVIGIDYSAEYINQIVQSTTIQQVIITAIGLIILLVLIYFTIVRLIKPLNKVVHVADRVAHGDLTTLDLNSSNDEIGKLAESIRTMVENLKSIITNIRDTSDHLAASSEELSANSKEAFQFSSSVYDEIEKVAKNADTILTITDESAAAMEESAEGIQKIAESASAVAESSHTTSNEARKGSTVVNNLVNQMNLISDSVNIIGETITTLNDNSNKISEFVGFITAIADQTNLLALNAAIEAARAGEHGKGFAVVADEVRKLAEQSASSAGHISKLIQDIQTSSKTSVEAMEKGKENVVAGHSLSIEAGELFNRILSSAELVAKQIDAVSLASQQLSASSEQVAASVNEMKKMAEQSAENSDHVTNITKQQLHSMDEISSASESLETTATELQQLIQKFNLGK